MTHSTKKLLLILFSLYVFCFLFIASPLNNTIIYPKTKSVDCYRIKTESLQDIGDVKIRKGKSIFFHETSCKSFLARKVKL